MTSEQTTRPAYALRDALNHPLMRQLFGDIEDSGTTEAAKLWPYCQKLLDEALRAVPPAPADQRVAEIRERLYRGSYIGSAAATVRYDIALLLEVIASLQARLRAAREALDAMPFLIKEMMAAGSWDDKTLRRVLETAEKLRRDATGEGPSLTDALAVAEAERDRLTRDMASILAISGAVGVNANDPAEAMDRLLRKLFEVARIAAAAIGADKDTTHD